MFMISLFFAAIFSNSHEIWLTTLAQLYITIITHQFKFEEYATFLSTWRSLSSHNILLHKYENIETFGGVSFY